MAFTILITNVQANELDDSLREAVNKNRVFRSIKLLIKGANPVTPDEQGITALQIATSKRMHIVLELMLVLTKKIDDADKRGWSPLFYSIQNNSLLVTKELLYKGADPNQREQITGMSPLEYAIQISPTKTIEHLMKRNANIEGSDFFGNNAIMYAAEKNDYTLLLKLYEQYHDTFLQSMLHKNTNNEMALTFAALNQNVKNAIILYILGERKFSIDLTNNYVLDSNGNLPTDYFNEANAKIFNCATNTIELFGQPKDWETASRLKKYLNFLYEQCKEEN